MSFGFQIIGADNSIVGVDGSPLVVRKEGNLTAGTTHIIMDDVIKQEGAMIFVAPAALNKFFWTKTFFQEDNYAITPPSNKSFLVYLETGLTAHYRAVSKAKLTDQSSTYGLAVYDGLSNLSLCSDNKFVTVNSIVNIASPSSINASTALQLLGTINLPAIPSGYSRYFNATRLKISQDLSEGGGPPEAIVVFRQPSADVLNVYMQVTPTSINTYTIPGRQDIVVISGYAKI